MVLTIPPEQELADCCRKGNVERATELLDWGVPPDARVGPRSVLTIAVEADQLAMAKLLIRAGARPEGRDLTRAVLTGDVYLAELIADELFFAGEALDLWFENRPLLCRQGFLASTTPRMVGFLLKQGADPTETDEYGRDALDWARREGADPEIRALLEGAAAA